MIKQRTIKKSVTATGIGLHSGKKVFITFKPAQANTGIVFIRTDVTPNVLFKTSPEMVRDTELCTALVTEDGCRVSTVEHLSAALSALGIDNLVVEVNAPELPVMDGSAQPFIYLLEDAGIELLDAPKKFIKIKKTVRVELEDKWAELRPSDKGFQLDLQIDFDHPAMDRDLQHYKLNFSGTSFFNEVSRARTFCFMRDVEFMHAHNLALGGSLENAVVLDDYKVVNPEGLRYNNEFVKHKMLDAIGDLYMSNMSILGSFVAYKTGHHLNNMLIRTLLSDAEAYEIVNIDDSVANHNSVSFIEKLEAKTNSVLA
ncbi:MAG: UDP-3-O-acyl-N-acetylglucosamine deacetylase [Succinivibrionaceae bacterium]|nr:UDP-3-O-acyl-N-acetylglucosamine deacetylase [Ruminobacter sp.]MDY5779648.1 UDP-3-O-acyl-N-acetylglucosamine deacetylase [Succinivibrionaceae bacterium]MEE1339169.1 UDP-3-O-acyl-N-acetylglucosamine deacetylase [Succinivibrionaceae bacterium]